MIRPADKTVSIGTHIPVWNIEGQASEKTEVTDKLLRFAKNDFQPTRIFEVPVFYFVETVESKV
jgi:hypothetical protein